MSGELRLLLGSGQSAHPGKILAAGGAERPRDSHYGEGRPGILRPPPWQGLEASATALGRDRTYPKELKPPPPFRGAPAQTREGALRPKRAPGPASRPPGPLIGRKERAYSFALRRGTRAGGSGVPRRKGGGGGKAARGPPLPPRLGPAGAGWASWARWLEPGRRRRPEAAARPAPRRGAGGDRSERAAPDETAGGLAAPEPGGRVAGAEDVDAAEPAHPLAVREHDERPGRAGGARGRQEGGPPGTAGRRAGAWRPGLRALRGHCTGRRPRRLGKFPRRALGRGPATPFVTCPAAEASGSPAEGPSAGAPTLPGPALFPRPAVAADARPPRRPAGAPPGPGRGGDRGQARCTPYPAERPSFCLAEPQSIQRAIETRNRVSPAAHLSGTGLSG